MSIRFVFSFLISILLLVLILIFRQNDSTNRLHELSPRFFQIQSIDTMKYSRDVAREKLDDLAFDTQIDTQVKNIAETGATHVAIATPYDAEFVPFLARWVAAARKYHLNVWFRGNFSGWEEWFDYPRIDRDTHTEQIERFIFNNQDLFVDGDIFVSCPECENGGPGDPRMNGDAAGHRAFLIHEYQIVTDAFKKIGKNITANYYSMNGDVAELIMDPETTRALGGVVTIDHYVADPDQLIADIRRMHETSGGLIVLGEFGAPIPDIHGHMDDPKQAEWISDALDRLAQEPAVIGINYWVNLGGSTRLWHPDNTPYPAVAVLNDYFTPAVVTGQVMRPSGRSIDDVQITSPYARVVSTEGAFALPVAGDELIIIEKKGYERKELTIPDIQTNHSIILNPTSSSFVDKLNDIVYQLFH